MGVKVEVASREVVTTVEMEVILAVGKVAAAASSASWLHKCQTRQRSQSGRNFGRGSRLPSPHHVRSTAAAG